MLLAWKPNLSFPVSVVDACSDIGNLFLKNYSSSCIASQMSAISYVHKVLVLQDPTQTFIAKIILKGCQASVPMRDTRLPITPNILRKLLNALAHIVPQYSLRILLRALFLLAFHAFLRLGEVAVKSLQKSHLVLQRQDVTFEYDGPRQARIQAGALPARATPKKKKKKKKRERERERRRGKRKKGGNNTFNKRKNVC